MEDKSTNRTKADQTGPDKVLLNLLIERERFHFYPIHQCLALISSVHLCCPKSENSHQGCNVYKDRVHKLTHFIYAGVACTISQP